MTELSQLTPTQARKILALAATSVLAKETRTPTMIRVHIDGPVTEAALKAAAHQLLEEKRRARGDEPVDLARFRVDQ